MQTIHHHILLNLCSVLKLNSFFHGNVLNCPNLRLLHIVKLLIDSCSFVPEMSHNKIVLLLVFMAMSGVSLSPQMSVPRCLL